jgi:WD40 repeat protein
VAEWRIADSSRIDLVPPVEGFKLDEDGKPVEFGSLAPFPDYDGFVTGDTLGALRGWDMTGRPLFAFDLGDRIHSIALSPDGRFLAAGCVDKKLLVFDLGTSSPAADLGTEYEYVSNLTFSPDGTTLLATYERPGNVMKTWDTASWREIATLRQSDLRFDYHDIIYSNDGRQIVMTGTRLDIEFLDAVTGEGRGILKGHSRAPYQLAFSPDGSLLASAADDMTLRIWDVKTGQCLRMFKAGNEIFSVAFSPDGSLLAFAVRGEGIRVLAVRD